MQFVVNGLTHASHWYRIIIPVLNLSTVSDNKTPQVYFIFFPSAGFLCDFPLSFTLFPTDVY